MRVAIRFDLYQAVLLLLAASPQALTQQPKPLAGVVVDTRNRAGIGEVHVELMTENNTVVASAITDSLGRFTLSAPATGIRLNVRRLGFAPWSGALEVPRKDSIVVALEP